ncbi:MAG: hypothetical protein EBX50_18185 [Chitinophagia bacterium]|nr:hypothetical protein [Chitinophagia bacterium]
MPSNALSIPSKEGLDFFFFSVKPEGDRLLVSIYDISAYAIAVEDISSPFPDPLTVISIGAEHQAALEELAASSNQMYIDAPLALFIGRSVHFGHLRNSQTDNENIVMRPGALSYVKYDGTPPPTRPNHCVGVEVHVYGCPTC